MESYLVGIVSGLLTFVIMTFSLYSILQVKTTNSSIFSWTHFINLLMVYIIIITGFSIIYLCLEVTGHASITSTTSHDNTSSFGYIGNVIYFSAMTTLSVGYGDLIPVGLAKLFAVLQALIGFLLPAAFIVSGFVISLDKKQYLYEKELSEYQKEPMDKR